jgi:hypothetical protein
VKWGERFSKPHSVCSDVHCLQSLVIYDESQGRRTSKPFMDAVARTLMRNVEIGVDKISKRWLRVVDRGIFVSKDREEGFICSHSWLEARHFLKANTINIWVVVLSASSLPKSEISTRPIFARATLAQSSRTLPPLNTLIPSTDLCRSFNTRSLLRSLFILIL